MWYWPHFPVCNITRDRVWGKVCFLDSWLWSEGKMRKPQPFSLAIFFCASLLLLGAEVHMTVELWTIFYPETWVRWKLQLPLPEMASDSPVRVFLASWWSPQSFSLLLSSSTLLALLTPSQDWLKFSRCWPMTVQRGFPTPTFLSCPIQSIVLNIKPFIEA